jgi:hypothetical protein
VTAEHVVEAQPRVVSLKVTVYGADHELRLTRVPGIPEGADVAAFRLEAPLTRNLPILASLNRIIYTQDVFFLGFPYGLGLRRAGLPLMPFVKKAILSASIETDSGVHILLLDGFNNVGFSGGPVVFYTPDTNEPSVCGVISGYLPEERPVRVGDVELDATVMENTGIVIAYDIKHVIEALP